MKTVYIVYDQLGRIRGKSLSWDSRCVEQDWCFVPVQQAFSESSGSVSDFFKWVDNLEIVRSDNT